MMKSDNEYIVYLISVHIKKMPTLLAILHLQLGLFVFKRQKT